MADKSLGNRSIEVDRTQIEERLNFTRENYRMMREELLKIVYWTPEKAVEGMRGPRVADRVEAGKNVVMMDLALLNAEIANGLCKKPTAEHRNSATSLSRSKSAR